MRAMRENNKFTLRETLDKQTDCWEFGLQAPPHSSSINTETIMTLDKISADARLLQTSQSPE